MTHIICRALTCLFWEQGVCSADEIEYEPNVGCLTCQDLGDFELVAEEEEEEAWDEGEAPYGEEEEEWEAEVEEWGDDEELQV